MLFRSADDRISAVLPDGREIPLISGAESPDLVLPADFLADDDARAVIRLKVVDNTGKIGNYEIVITREARKFGNARLESLVPTYTDGEEIGNFIFNLELKNHKIIVKRGTKEINLKAVAENPADNVVVNYNGTDIAGNSNNKIVKVPVSEDDTKNFVF